MVILAAVGAALLTAGAAICGATFLVVEGFKLVVSWFLNHA